MADGPGRRTSCAMARASTRCCWCDWIRRCSTRRPKSVRPTASWPIRRSVRTPAARWSTGPPDRQILECPCHNSQYDPRKVRGSSLVRRRVGLRRCRCALVGRQADGRAAVHRSTGYRNRPESCRAYRAAVSATVANWMLDQQEGERMSDRQCMWRVTSRCRPDAGSCSLHLRSASWQPTAPPAPPAAPDPMPPNGEPVAAPRLWRQVSPAIRR